PTAPARAGRRAWLSLGVRHTRSISARRARPQAASSRRVAARSDPCGASPRRSRSSAMADAPERWTEQRLYELVPYELDSQEFKSSLYVWDGTPGGAVRNDFIDNLSKQ